MKKYSLSLMVLALAMFPTFLFAQVLKVSQSDSKVEITGTSSLHDWTETVEDFYGSGNFSIESQKVQKVENVVLTFKVEGIKSGKSLMDKNTYNALKSEDHPTITFKSESSSISGNTISLKGKLNVAGTSKSVTLKGTYQVVNNQVKVKGEFTMDMTQYNVEPPTAMMGTITTGKDVTIVYDVIFK
tara:strand:- start:232 stop:789 length:558 start_codon:yes stop_codon:yes gene_type:complete